VVTPGGLLRSLADLYDLALERTGLAARIATWPVLPPDQRAAWIAVAATSAVLLLYAALASGKDRAVEASRVVFLLLGACLPLAALRLVATPRRAPFVGATLLVLLAAGLVHRGLAGRRRAGTAAGVIRGARGVVEVAGLGLFAVGAGTALAGGAVPVRLAFWALFLLRLSVADLVDPSRLAHEAGLPRSAVKDLKGAVRPKGRRSPPGRRLRRLTVGALKLALLVLWLALPVLSALAPGEVAAGEWPAQALLLRWYPPVALGLTGLVLLFQALRSVAREPLDAARGLIVGAATWLSLWFAYRDPAFTAYRDALPGLYLVETVFGFLLGAASRGGRA